MNRLINIGFISVGHWSLNNNDIKYNLTSHHLSSNVLYSFISNGEVKYIGKTRLKLNQRMYGYQNPGPSQTTNIRVNGSIKNLLEQNIPIDIFILADNGLLRYGDFKINLAAGLEDTLIFELNPEWNLTGKNIIPLDKESENADLIKNPIEPDELITSLITIDIKLGRAYYNQGFFNVTRKNSNCLGLDKSTIEIQLGKKNTRTIQGYINRTANTNGTPRIMGGKDLKNWIQENFRFNESMKVDIISPVSIRLFKD